MKLPSYLRITRHNIYVFRRRIPKDVEHYFYTNEIRKSLYETNKNKAVIKARILALKCEEIFYCLRNDYPMSKELSKELSDLIKHKKELIAKDERLAEKEEIVWDLHRKILAERKAHAEQLERELTVVKSTASTAIETAYKPKGKEVLLSELVRNYFDENELKRRGESLSTIRKDKEAITLFLDFVGDKYISTVTQSDAAKFSQIITTYKTKIDKPRAALTANKYLNSISKFSGWITAFHSETNHTKLDFSNYKFKNKTKPSEARDAFTDAEVSRILNSPDYAKQRNLSPAVFWLICIAAYSGARLEEIAQLDPANDIYKIDSVWIFDINDNGEKQLKNRSSKRVVPIHSRLIELGLIKLVNKLKIDGQRALLESENIRDGRIGKNAGKRVKTFIKSKIGIPNKSLHNFRHTFITKLKKLEVNESIAASIVGHAHPQITYGTYGKNYDIQQLKKNIELIKY